MQLLTLVTACKLALMDMIHKTLLQIVNSSIANIKAQFLLQLGVSPPKCFEISWERKQTLFPQQCYMRWENIGRKHATTTMLHSLPRSLYHKC